MDATLYTGAGGNSTITNTAGFLPDLTWIKGRSNTGSHVLQDTNRGAGSAKKLSSNSTNAENNAAGDATDPIYGYISAFNSNGFSVVDGTTPAQTNKSGVTYVGWQWTAGQNTTTSNTSGTITSTVSANVTAGFSIVTYSAGANNSTVGHGLGAAPNLIIVKSRTSTIANWPTYHSSLGKDVTLELNTTSNSIAISNYWGTSAPNSTVFGISTNGFGNNLGNLVAYCWTSVPGFSQFGSYTGNGSTDGPFIYTGFRPKYVMIKRTDATDYWYILDTSRNTYNVANLYLDANDSVAEGTATFFDILSNGFKIRATGTYENASGGNYIYMAFAETPFKFANAR